MKRRSAVLALLSLPLGYFKAFASQAGMLTINLDQWKAIQVTKGEEVITLSVKDIFEALK